jgi:DNA-binding MarR family transcriptional regulator
VDEIPPKPPELLEAAYIASIGATSLAQRMRAERPPDGTTLSMISVLSHLDREGAMAAGRLAALQRSKPQTLTRTLARLEERGWIERGSTEEDRRRLLVRLTEKGSVRLGQDVRRRAEWLARAMEALSPTEREVLRLAGTLMADLATWDDIDTAQDPR